MNGIVYGPEYENANMANTLSHSITAMNILKKCSFSKLNTNSVDAPFFNPDIDDETTIERMSMSMKDNATVTKIANRIHLPPTLTRIYELLDSYKREFTYHNFTFFAINELKRRLELFEDDLQYNICDIATAYHGMGHIIVLSWDRINNAFFLRRDGGSNDYDRKDNWDFIREYDTSKTPIIKQILPVTLFNVLSRENVEDYNEFLIN